MNMSVLVPLLTVYLVWGSTYLAIRYAIETIPPFLMAALRFLTAGALFYAWGVFNRHARPTFIQWRTGLIVGGFLLVGGNGLVVFAEKTVPSGMAALLVSTVPLWMVLFGREKTTVWGWLGIVGGFFGIVLLVGPSVVGNVGALPLGGCLLLCLASVLWAIGSVYSRRAPHAGSHVMATAAQMLAGGALLFIIGLMTGERVIFAEVSARSWWSLLYLIVFGALVGFTAYTWLLKTASISVTSTYAYVNPVVAIFLGWLVAGEPIGPRTLVASAVIILSVVVITSQRRV
jgi:drug/metabolite transporter (DMT)-like permease